jgi:ankyrin repeat protein
MKRRSFIARVIRGNLLVLALGVTGLPAASAADDPLVDLMIAIDIGDVQKVKNLLSRGMEVETTDEMGNTLLMRASRIGSVKMVEFLLQAGANVNARNAFSDSALMLAALNGYVEVCRLLLDHGAEFDTEGWTPLIYAASRGHNDVVVLLLSLDCDIDATSENGTTALMLAADGGHMSTVKLLLEHKADFDLANEAGLTAISWAAKHKNTDIIDVLKAAGEKK